jgi:hypothetical protein
MRYRYLFICLLLMIFVGCTQNRVPDMPNFTTEEQKTCGQKCLSIHSRCSAACGEMFGDPQTENQLQKCQNNCNSVLGDCYDTCK